MGPKSLHENMTSDVRIPERVHAQRPGWEYREVPQPVEINSVLNHLETRATSSNAFPLRLMAKDASYSILQLDSEYIVSSQWH